MKKLAVGILVALLFGIWSYSKSGKSEPLRSPQPSPSPNQAFNEPILGLSTNESDLVQLTVDGKTYRATWIAVTNPENVSVGLNQDLASSSADIRNRENCRALTNGSFYATSGRTIGMVVNNGQELSKWQQNTLFNGVLSGSSRTLSIQPDKPEDPDLDWAVQAGPIVWADGKPVNLAGNTNGPARRMLAGVTVDHKLVLMVVLASDSLFQGPPLADVPAVVAKLQEVTGKTFQSVINLDGGTASAFLSDEVSLKELKPIGSYLCIK